MNIDERIEMDTTSENSSADMSPDIAVTSEIDEQTWREIASDKPDEPESTPEYTVEYILSRMEAIRKDTQHIDTALEAFRNFEPSCAANGGVGDAERSKAILEIVKSHEQILERELALLERMYDNLTGKKESAKISATKKLLGEINFPTDNNAVAAYMTDTITQVLLSIKD